MITPPGNAETKWTGRVLLRVNGRAVLSKDPALLERFRLHDTLPRTVIVVTADAVYYQCPKALVRSDLWNPTKHIDRKALPSAGKMLADISSGKVDGEEWDRAYPERLRKTIY